MGKQEGPDGTGLLGLVHEAPSEFRGARRPRTTLQNRAS